MILFAIGSVTMLHLSDQCSSLQNIQFTGDLVGFWPLGAVEEYKSESVYLELNSKFLPTGAGGKQVSLALSS